MHVALLLLFTLALNGCLDGSSNTSRSVSKDKSKNSGSILDSDQNKNLINGDYSPADMQKMSLGELSWLVEERWAQNQFDANDLVRKSALNQSLCDELVRLRQTCALTKPLGNTSANDDLACSSAAGQKDTVQKIRVVIPAGKQGPFDLVINDLYKAVVNGGENKDVKFVALSRASIRFIDIFSATLRMKDDTSYAKTMPDITGFSFSLYYGDTAIITDGQLKISAKAPLDSTGKAKPALYDINVSNIVSQKASPLCKMTKNDIDAVKKAQELRITEMLTRSDINANKQHDAKRDSLLNLGSEDRKEALIEEIVTQRAQIQARATSLDAESSRLINLTMALSTESSIGCHYEDELKTLEILVKGSISNFPVRPSLNPRDFVPRPKQNIPLEAVVNDLRIDLGGGLVFDLPSTDYMGQKYMASNLPKVILGAIDRFYILKKSVEYTSYLTACSNASGFVANFGRLFDSSVCYSWTENKVMSIDGIQVTANGMLIFDSNESIKLKSGQTSWSDFGALRMGTAWNQMMQKQDCDIVN